MGDPPSKGIIASLAGLGSDRRKLARSFPYGATCAPMAFSMRRTGSPPSILIFQTPRRGSLGLNDVKTTQPPSGETAGRPSDRPLVNRKGLPPLLSMRQTLKLPPPRFEEKTMYRPSRETTTS